jgi:hypothetical protein
MLPTSISERIFLVTDRPIARDALTARSPHIGIRNNLGETIFESSLLPTTSALT